MKSYFIILVIIFMLCLIGPTSIVNSSNSDFTQSSSDKPIFINKNLYFTGNNISLGTNKIFLGFVSGTGVNYYVSALLSEEVNLSIHLIITKGTETSFISLTPKNPVWNGNLTFKDDGSTVNKNLYTNLQFFNLDGAKNQSNIILSINYSIYTTPITQTRVIDGRTIEVNALGYPYPDRNYILGLMILLVGSVPVAIIVNILKRFMRRKKLKKENIKD